MRQFLKLIWKFKHAGPKSTLEETIDIYSITIPEVDTNGSSAIILLTNVANENCIATANTASCINSNDYYIGKNNDRSALSTFFVPLIHVFMSHRK